MAGVRLDGDPLAGPLVLVLLTDHCGLDAVRIAQHSLEPLQILGFSTGHKVVALEENHDVPALVAEKRISHESGI